jgi:hypothetical protein
MLSTALSMMLIFHQKVKFVNLSSKKCKSKLAAKQLKEKPRSHSKNGTISSFKASNLIIKKCKPLIERGICKRVLSLSS